MPSSTSVQPSPSSSSSVSSGSPSPSVSSSSAHISIAKEALCWLLLAQTVKLVGTNSAVAIPVIEPVELSKESPEGIAGETSQVRTSPPFWIGERDALVMLTVRASDDSAYARNISESSTSSSASHVPSLSLSVGVLESSSESVPHADSSVSTQSSLSSSGSVVSGTPSPSVSSRTVMLTVA